MLFHINGILYHVVFCDQFLLLGIAFPRFVYPCCSTSLYFVGSWRQLCFTVRVYHVLFIWSSVEEHLGCFPLLAKYTYFAGEHGLPGGGFCSCRVQFSSTASKAEIWVCWLCLRSMTDRWADPQSSLEAGSCPGESL